MLGIIGAMQIEIHTLQESITDKSVRTISGMTYVSGQLYGRDVTAVVCGAGKVASAICAQTLIREFGADQILNTGVAGTLCNELGIGDAAIASDVVQHDMDCTALGYSLGTIPDLNLREIPCDAAMVSALAQAVSDEGRNYRIGTVASGDMFLHTTERKEMIAAQFRAIAGEMEGAAIGQVCRMNNIPFAVLRTISDDASGGAPASFETFAGEAAAVASSVVRRFIYITDRNL